MDANLQSDRTVAREGYIPVGNAALYYRDIGQRQPVVVLHGGPDFSHSYLIPDLDRLSDSFRLIYYDQRGRGKSADNVQPEDVTIESEIEDLESLREYFGLQSVAVLGHSWGGILAMEYATRHPDRVSHLILMNSAPASRDDYVMFRESWIESIPDDIEKLQAIGSTAAYAEGDLETDAAYYRIQYGPTLRQPEQLERLVGSLRLNVNKEGILKSREIEDRLMDETWRLSDYTLLPRLERLSIPTLVIHGDYDFVPVACSEHIAQAIPGARFVLLKECGHFSYLECPEDVRREMRDFFGLQ